MGSAHFASAHATAGGVPERGGVLVLLLVLLLLLLRLHGKLALELLDLLVLPLLLDPPWCLL
jgi:hypothetical protein